MKIVYFVALLSHIVESLHMVQYPHRVSDHFLETIQIAAYPDDDPLNLSDLRCRQMICDQIIGAKRYIVIPDAQQLPSSIDLPEEPIHAESLNIQRLESSSENPDPEHLRYAEKSVTFWFYVGPRQLQYRVSVMLLECVRTIEKNWFVAFTKQEEKMFLIERWKSPSARLVVKGVIESRAEYNINFPGTGGLQRLHQYFSEQLNLDRRNEPALLVESENSSLCFLKRGEHARLCSAAFDTLSHPSVGLFQEQVRHKNYCVMSYRRCLSRSIMLKSGQVVRSKVLPCIINQKRNSPQFFAVADSKVSGAAFIFVEKFRNTGTKRLQLIGRLTKIVVLLDRLVNQEISEN